jgi:glycosyltransferase involved in cell wall biosynthesis
VLHVLEAFAGGTSRHVVDIVRHAPDVVHEVAIPRRRVGWVTDETAADEMTAAGAHLHRVEMRRSPANGRNAVALASLRRLITTMQPDIIHGHSSVGGALARLAAWDLPIPSVYTPNGLATSAPIVLAERLLARRTKRFVAVSASEGDLAVRLGIVPADRLAIIPNGIDPTAPPPAAPDLRRRLALAPDVPLIGSVARLVPQKAPLDYVKTCAGVARECATAHFVLIGSGPLESAVEREVLCQGLRRRFHQLPVLPGAAAALGDLDALVSTSKFEGGPYTPIEAMRVGTPVVLSDVVGNRDTIEHGTSGLLVPQGDIDGFATAILTLLRDDELRGRLGAAGRARVDRSFDVAAMGRALTGVYHELVTTRDDPLRTRQTVALPASR